MLIFLETEDRPEIAEMQELALKTVKQLRLRVLQEMSESN